MFWKRLFSIRQKDTTATRSQRGGSYAEQWKKVFEQHRDALAAVAELLLDVPCSPSLILFNAEHKLREQAVPEEFRYTCALHQVALVALTTHLGDDSREGFEFFGCRMCELADLVTALKTIPLQERAVLFLREVLGYSRREIGIMLRVSDTGVEQLLLSSRLRILEWQSQAPDDISWSFRDHLFGSVQLKIGSQAETSEGILPLSEEVA
jgi:hypothetical protein